ncbi:MAG: hypothetical protein ABJQ29_16685 [Luteolibacter sp.]
MLKYTHRPGGSANCPECQEPISKLANICPHCRSDLASNEAWQAKKSDSAGGCAMLIAFGLFLGGITAVTFHSLNG